jgi:hypothetical protein
MGKVRIGANVRLLNEVGEGVVTGVNRDGHYLVMMTDGFEIPYAENQLVMIDGGKETSSSNEQVIGSNIGSTSLNDSLYLAFVLDGIIKDQPAISVRLINQRNEAFLLAIYSETERKFQLEHSGELGAKAQKSMLTLSLPDLLSRDRFFIQVQAITRGPAAPPLAWSGFVKHQVPAIVEPSSWPALPEVSARAIVIEVYPDKGSAPLKLHNKDRQSTMIKASQDWLLKEGRDGRFEVDLHIEELLEDTSGMENADIIRYQLRYFEKCLDEAQRRPVKRFVVIHGVGKGRLRDEIRKQLSADNIEHYDAPLSKYGFGATEIIIR